MYRILVCDDEKDIVSALTIYLESEGYEVIPCFNGQEAIDVLHEKSVHLVLLDIMMPVMDGMMTLRQIRTITNVPVIFLTAKGEDTDKVLGLTVGADDYITKPFNPVELLARVKSHLRRYMQLGGHATDEHTLRLGGIELNDDAKEAYLDGELINLTRTEYDILKFLMSHPGKVFRPGEIYSKVWNDVSLGNESTVAVHIRHLREKIEYDPANPRYLKAVWGRGYKMEGDDNEK